MKGVIPTLIASNQSGFVKGRSIFENILLTQEIVAHIRLRGKAANVVLKLDMAKAYDRVSWRYLMHVPRKMRFAEHFITLIRRLIMNNWYSVLVNGQATGFFQSTRGVKQGDPLSPILNRRHCNIFSLQANLQRKCGRPSKMLYVFKSTW
uniref:Reverse transcriptase n=1 Tax=Solanum tuberosum TaxID=4113 RepID=M1A3C1_SOLTU